MPQGQWEPAYAAWMRSALVTLFTCTLLTVGLPAALASAPPDVGACYDYSASQGVRGASTPPVNCAENHRAETFFVGSVSGRFPGPNQATRRDRGREIARNCTDSRLQNYLGLTSNFPTRFRIFAHFPNQQQWNAGQRWVRCDLGLRSGLELEKWRGSAPALVASTPRAQFNYCTPSVGFLSWPDPLRTRAQSCNAPKKQWILVAKPTLGAATARYRGQRSTERIAQTKCREFRNTYPGKKPRPERAWFFSYPTSAGWDEGERQALCWVPLSQYVDTVRAEEPAPSVDDSAARTDSPRYVVPHPIGNDTDAVTTASEIEHVECQPGQPGRRSVQA